MNIIWIIKPFSELTTEEFHNIIQLRELVFVVEQECYYLDVDGKDKQAIHVFGYTNNALMAYSRILPKGISYKEASIGRVVVHPKYRNKNLGKMLMEKSIETLYNNYGKTIICISAQSYLLAFYGSFGFVKQGEEYLEDGIPHWKMIKR